MDYSDPKKFTEKQGTKFPPEGSNGGGNGDRQNRDDFYVRSFVHTPKWSNPQPNQDELARWQKISRLLRRISKPLDRDEESPWRILDVGCGRGWLTQLASEYGSCEGVDPVSGVIAAARRQFPHLKFYDGELREIPCHPDFQPYDSLVVSEVIEHVPGPEQKAFVLSLGRLLKPGGYVILTTPRGEIFNEWMHLTGNSRQPVEDWLTESGLQALFVECGFQPVDRDRIFIDLKQGNFITEAFSVRNPSGRVLPLYQVWLFALTPRSQPGAVEEIDSFCGATGISRPGPGGTQAEKKQGHKEEFVAHYVIHTHDFFLEDSIESVAPFVDKILIARTTTPWFGPAADPGETDKVLREIKADYGEQVEIYEKAFPDEHTQRNFLARLSEERGHRGAFLVDADEVFTGQAFPLLYRYIEQQNPPALGVPYLTFIKDASFCVAPPYELGLFYINLTLHPEFLWARRCSLEARAVRWDEPEILHFSYLRKDDDEVWRKIKAFTHSREDVNWDEWFQTYYLNFHPRLKNFHPTAPSVWSRLEEFDPARFPPRLRAKLRAYNKLFYHDRIKGNPTLRLHLGCGRQILPDYINIDLYNPAADLKMDITDLTYFEDESIDEIFMNAVFEHLYTFEQRKALAEWHRVLKPNGILKIHSIPDFDEVIKAYIRKAPGNGSPIFDLREVQNYVFGVYDSETRLGGIHKDLFTKEKVTELLTEEGFEVLTIEDVCWGNEPNAVGINCVSRKSATARRPQTRMLYQKARELIKEGRFAEAVPVMESVLGVVRSTPVQSGGERKLVSIIILTFNAIEYTKKCLESIFAHTMYPFELVLVDNGSTDGTPEYFAALCRGEVSLAGRQVQVGADGTVLPCGGGGGEDIQNELPGSGNQRTASSGGLETGCRFITVIRNPVNLGFPQGNNQGMAAARGDYFLLLNNDVVVTPGWLEKLIAWAEHKKNVGIVGPVSNFAAGRQLVAEFNYDPVSLAGLDDFAEEYGRNHVRQGLPFLRIIGFCMLIKKAVVEKIGGFDLRYGYGYFEDDDFSLRANLAGFESWIAKDCFIHHFGSRTFVGERVDILERMLRNWELFKKKWGIPPDVDIRVRVDLTQVLKKGFDPQLHVCRLEPEINYLKRGEEFFQNGDLKSARKAFEKALEHQPGNPAVLNDLGVLSFQEGSPDAALSFFRQALQNGGDNADVLVNAGDCLMSQEIYPEAISCLRRALDCEPGNVSVLNSLGNCFIQTHDFAAAAEMFLKSYQLDSAQPRVFEILKDLEKLQNQLEGGSPSWERKR